MKTEKRQDIYAEKLARLMEKGIIVEDEILGSSLKQKAKDKQKPKK